MKIYLLILVLIIAFSLRLYLLDDLMPFIGDFAWFYLSARDMLITHEIPLVGIASSHTWVHQGPLWTYMLAIPLLISNFNPLSGAYFTAMVGTVTVFFVYKIGTQMFSKFVGFTAAVLYATSPIVIIHSRMPYHTSFIPLASLLFILFLYKWIKGDIRYLPYTLLMLGVLYNLELATLVFWILLLLIFAFGAINKEKWFKEAIKLKTVLLSVFLFLLVMLPMLIYDFKENSGFYQMTAFFRLIKVYLLSQSHVFSFEAIVNAINSLFFYNNRLVFLANNIFATVLTLISFLSLIFVILKRNKDKKNTLSLLLLGLWFIFPFLGIIVSGTVSEAYAPMLFPPIIFIISLFLARLMQIKTLFTLTLLIIIFICSINVYYLISKNYLMGDGYGVPFQKRINTIKKIIKESGKEEYNIIGVGKGSQFESFTMGYEYLGWWLGKEPSKKKTKLQFRIKETSNQVIVTKNMK